MFEEIHTAPIIESDFLFCSDFIINNSFSYCSFGIDTEANLFGLIDSSLENILDLNTGEILGSTPGINDQITYVGELFGAPGDIDSIAYYNPIGTSNVKLETSELISIDSNGEIDIEEALTSDDVGQFVIGLQQLTSSLFGSDKSEIIQYLSTFVKDVLNGFIPDRNIPDDVDRLFFREGASSRLKNLTRLLFESPTNTLETISDRLELLAGDGVLDVLAIDPDTSLFGIVESNSDDLLDINTREILNDNVGTTKLIGLLERDILTGQPTGKVISPYLFAEIPETDDLQLSSQSSGGLVDDIRDAMDEVKNAVVNLDDEAVFDAYERAIGLIYSNNVLTKKVKEDLSDAVFFLLSEDLREEVENFDPRLNNITNPVLAVSNFFRNSLIPAWDRIGSIITTSINNSTQ